MKNELTMRLDTPYTLNFLIYLQNLYLNQKQIEEQLKFPYLSEKVMFSDDFELNFKELWEDVSIRISKDDMDLILFNDENNLFYEKLFIPNSDSLKTYKEIYTGFRVWWSSYAGGFSVERSIDDPSHNIYIELTNSLKKNHIEPKKQLNISLIYDECLLTNTEFYSYYTVLSIVDIHANHKDLVFKLQRCIS
ncbi:hypothetical protein CSE16_12830 [Solibacillus sp. R5-41]|uniref:hypothetical protein n=1 Tax=Solibacillus sp. R5-41 TaxID=2048654 RepID=UPI000C12463D|nr:hypothetical protein [Solibacillus sp. R5-41]ATP40857.1 hypothetical protein CSE16_12830 [Solibacillus sp. R5-41]